MTSNDNISEKPIRAERDLTQGSVVRHLAALSWPVMISQSLNVCGPLIDLIWVGKLGSAAVAGVGIAGMVVMLAMAAMLGLTTGVRALVARLFGSGDEQSARNAAVQAYIIGFSFFIIIAAIGMSLAEQIMAFFGAEAEVVELGAIYLRIMFISSLAQALWQISEATMQAAGDTVSPMRIVVGFRVLHLVLCPLLVFGWGFVPSLGVSGAAISNAVSQSVGLVLGLWILFAGRTRIRLTLRGFHFDLPLIWRMVKVALPNIFMHIQHHFFTLSLLKLIAPFGTIAVAAHTVWQRTDLIVVILGMAVGISAGVIGAQNLGARQPERAVRAGWTAAIITVVVMAITSVIVLVWAEAIVSVFNTEPEMIKVTSSFLRIAVASYLAVGFNSVFMIFLIIMGDTLAALVLEMVHTWGVQLPLAYVMTKYTDMGIYGVRWAMVIGLIFAGIIFTLYFWWGRWKTKKV